MQRDPGVGYLGATAMKFSRFPVELHHHILCFTEPEDILALRKTCKYFFALTQEPRVWMAVYDRMRNTHPLGCCQSEFATLSVSQSERLLVRASKTEKVFKTEREDIQDRIIPTGQAHKMGPLAALSFLSERFILSVDDTTVVCVWDIPKLASSAKAPAFPCARLTLFDWRFVTYYTSFDHSTLYIILSKGARAHIFSLSLPLNASDTDEPKLSFRDVAYFDTRLNRVQGIDVESCLVLLEHSHTEIEVVNWRTDSRSIVALQHDTFGPMPPWNDVLATRVCGPYILCFSHRSIDAYPIPPEFLKPELATETPLPALYHFFTGTGFSGGFSLSRVYCNRSPSGDAYSICALADRQRRGIFHYLIHLQITPKPSLSVRVLASDSANTDGRFSRLSAWDLGASGLRGVRVLKYDSDEGEDRHVVAFTTNPSLYPFDPNEVPPELSPPFDEQVVSVVSLRDSYDDVTRCAVSEFTGRIALGSRTGKITLL